MFSPHQQYASKLELYLYDLLHNHREDMSDTDRMFGMILGDVLKECGFQSFNRDEEDPQAIKSLEEVGQFVFHVDVFYNRVPKLLF